MSSFSNYLEQELLDHVFSLDAGYAQPSLYVALSSADPGEDGSGINEPSGNGYARVAFSNWVRSVSEVSNNADITFPTATGPWVGGANLTHFAIFDASSGGNMLAYGAITPAQAIAADNTVIYKTGNLTVSLD